MSPWVRTEPPTALRVRHVSGLRVAAFAAAVVAAVVVATALVSASKWVSESESV